MMDKSYTMKAAPVPQRRGRGSATVYHDIIEAFLSQEAESVIVTVPGRKTATVVIQLKKTVNESKKPVKVVQREGDVYLIRS
jgi:hypothetical protein